MNNAQQMDDYCKEKGFTAWFETSAKENVGIDEAARCLVTKVSTCTCMWGEKGHFIVGCFALTADGPSSVKLAVKLLNLAKFHHVYKMSL